MFSGGSLHSMPKHNRLTLNYVSCAGHKQSRGNTDSLASHPAKRAHHDKKWQQQSTPVPGAQQYVHGAGSAISSEAIEEVYLITNWHNMNPHGVMAEHAALSGQESRQAMRPSGSKQC